MLAESSGHPPDEVEYAEDCAPQLRRGRIRYESRKEAVGEAHVQPSERHTLHQRCHAGCEGENQAPSVHSGSNCELTIRTLKVCCCQAYVSDVPTAVLTPALSTHTPRGFNAAIRQVRD